MTVAWGEGIQFSRKHTLGSLCAKRLILCSPSSPFPSALIICPLRSLQGSYAPHTPPNNPSRDPVGAHIVCNLRHCFEHVPILFVDPLYLAFLSAQVHTLVPVPSCFALLPSSLPFPFHFFIESIGARGYSSRIWLKNKGKLYGHNETSRRRVLSLFRGVKIQVSEPVSSSSFLVIRRRENKRASLLFLLLVLSSRTYAYLIKLTQTSRRENTFPRGQSWRGAMPAQITRVQFVVACNIKTRSPLLLNPSLVFPLSAPGEL